MSHRRPDCLSFAAAIGRLLVLLVLVPSGLAPIAPAQDLRYLHHQSWSTEDGLPQNSVHQILQSPDGFLWIATEGGVARFDGLTFQTFSHANTPAFTSDDTCCLANGGDGSLWIGTADGLLRLRNQTFTRVDEHSVPAEVLSLLHNNASSPGPDEGHAQGPHGELWSFSKSAVSVNAHGSHRQWTSAHGIPGSRIETLFVDRAGTAWVGTDNGLATIAATSTAATPIPALKGNVVLQIYEDREGNHWIGSETSGLHLLSPIKFRTEPALAEKALTALVQATDDSVWLGTRKDGLLRLRNGFAPQAAPPDSLTSPVVLSLAPGPQGSVWAGTPDGLNLVAPNGNVRRITSADGLPDDYIQALLAGPDGSVWIGTRHGLAHLRVLNPRSLKIDVLTQADGLGGDLIGTLLFTSAHQLWIGNSGGLSRLNLSPDPVPGAHITTFTTSDGLPPGIVTALAEDSAGTLWIATRGGVLTRFADGRFRTLQTNSFAADIAGIAADSRGFLWLRTGQGIARVALAELNRCAGSAQPCDPHLSHYGTADGIPSTELASGGAPVLWRMANGQLWCTTRRGVAITDPEHLSLNPTPPLVALERFLVDDASIPSTTAPIELPFGHARFTMEYAALSFTVPAEVRYRYRLEGFDPAWTDAGSRRSATYTNLPPRTYIFHVQAANNDGVWSDIKSDTGATLRFRIIPPLYRRWWFLVLALLAAAALAVTLYRLRLSRIQSRFDAVLAERNRLAREIHDTLAQDFVGISIQLDIVSQLLALSRLEPALEQVQQARKLVTEGLADARQSIWGLRSNLAHDSLPTRLAKVVERYSTPSLPIRLKIGGAFRQLPGRLESEVLRIAQESLSNVQRHSAAAHASIELRYGGDMLVLTVADDGRGFALDEASGRSGHYGLSGMNERAKIIGATLEIFTAPEAGTRVNLSAPIPGAITREPGAR